MLRTVELNLAFHWTCEDCGRDNFARPRVVLADDLDPEELSPQLVEEIETDRTAHWYMSPERVRCNHCKAIFDTVEA